MVREGIATADSYGNMSTYARTSSFKVNPVFGIVATHAILQSSEWSINTTNIIAAGLVIGMSVPLNDNWDLLIKYTPSVIHENNKRENLEEPYETTYSKGSLIWPYWGGVTFAYYSFQKL
ncbi:MAG: hypothetical protein ACJA0Q_002012 [Saprospiraceae bacterium]|jgi:hypothetical protein